MQTMGRESDLHKSIDTTTSGGKLIFHIFSALAEFERDVIRDRTKAGLVAARAWGRACTAIKNLVKLITGLFKWTRSDR